MKSLKAIFRIVTPMFCGGADQQAELRVPSIKGALRFWWRAQMLEKTGGDLKMLRKSEGTLFGSSDSGMSKVMLRLKINSTDTVIDKNSILNRNGTGTGDDRNRIGEGARYFGYGLMEAFDSRKSGKKSGQLTRQCLPAGGNFELSIIGKAMTGDELNELKKSLIAFGLFGGLGSRSRKGFGSISLVQLIENDQPIWAAPESVDEFIGQAQPFFQSGKLATLPEWTAFSSEAAQAVVIDGNDGESPLQLLNRIGTDQLFFRSWGNGGILKINGKESESEKRFKNDHDLMKKDVRDRNSHPERIAFGLPHNYGKQKQLHVEPACDTTRRASPIFIHIHQPNPDSAPLGVVTFLPSRFLPDPGNGRRPQISVGGTKIDCRPEKELWEPILEWMQSLKSGMRKKGVTNPETFQRVERIIATETGTEKPI